MLLKEERPLAFFSIDRCDAGVGLVILVRSSDFRHLRRDWSLAPRDPTAIVATGIMILVFLSLASAFILDSSATGGWRRGGCSICSRRQRAPNGHEARSAYDALPRRAVEGHGGGAATPRLPGQKRSMTTSGIL